MGSSKNNKPDAQDKQDKAASVAEEPQVTNDAPVSVNTSDSVLSASDGQMTVGGVAVIEHEQDSGEASEAGGA